MARSFLLPERGSSEDLVLDSMQSGSAGGIACETTYGVTYETKKCSRIEDLTR